jgi:hypothetical protein
MARFKFANNASALVTSAVSSTSTTVQLETGAGGLMPILATGDRFRGTLISADATTHEIVNATAVTGDVVAIERGQEGTAAHTFAVGSRFEVRMTAGMADNFLQRTGDSMSGPLDMNGQQIRNADFSGTATRFNIFHGSLWRATDVSSDQVYTTTENAIYLPPNSTVNRDSRRPGYFGRVVPNTEMFDNVVFDWFGDVNHVPSWFKLCNGTSGTPDLRGRFIKGWSDSFGVSGFDGYETSRPNSTRPFGIDFGLINEVAGQHNHTNENPAEIGHTGGTILTMAQLPTAVMTGVTTSPSGGAIADGTPNRSLDRTFNPGGGNPHDHLISPHGSHSHWIYQPPFYVLAKVMFTI